MKQPPSAKKSSGTMKQPPSTKKSLKSKSASSSKKDADVYQYEGSKIRNEKDRAGDISDDSDGGFKGEDESIDDDASEVGWDSDDEMVYGHMFKNKKSSNSSSNVQSDDSESDQEEPFEGEVLLSDIFSSKKTTTSSSSNDIEDDDEDEGGDDNNEDDAGSHSEDFDSDDEDEDEGDDDNEEEPSDEDDDDDDEAHNKLINAIDKFSKAHESEPDAKRKKISNQSAQESVFSSIADDGAVSMEALLGALGESKGLNVAKKQLMDLDKGTSVPAYVEKVIAERIERSLAYDGTSLEMAKWQETVSTNRNIRTLDLAQDKRIVPNYKNLVSKFLPRTDMEKEVQMILVKTGATDDLAERKEEDELGSRNFSIEEMKERQAELAKVKALMFYEQMKRHRLNKIKSKAYRRIRKRQKGKLDPDNGDLADLDPELAREEEEKEALRHVKERMDMKHKNTGKWARMALQHGQHDASLRMAYHESVQLGHELSKRVNDDTSNSSKRVREEDGDDGDGDDSSGDEGFQTEVKDGQKKHKASEKAAREMLSVLEGADDEPEATGKYKKLFEMDFMKRASDQKKEKSREEAQNILRELQEMEMEGEGGDYSDDEAAQPVDKKSTSTSQSDDKGKGKEGSSKGGASEALIAARAEMQRQLQGQGGSLTLKGGNKKISVSGPITVKGVAVKAKNSSVEWVTESYETVSVPTPAVSESDASNPWLTAPAQGKKRDSTGQQVINSKAGAGKMKGADKLYVTVADLAASTSANASVIAGVASSVTTTSSKKEDRKQNNVSLKDAVTSKKNTSTTRNTPNTSATSSSQPGIELFPVQGLVSVPVPPSKPIVPVKERKPLLMQKSQEDLVQIAFAGPDLEDDFVKMKGAAIDEELGIDEKRSKILSDVKAGWGDWAGPGATGVSAKILNVRNRLLKKVEEETEEKKKGRRDTKRPNVMISDRRIKGAAKFKISAIPHPFMSREEYERSMQMPLGAEWNASNVVKANSMPDILLRAGRVIAPITISKSQAAKQSQPEGAEPEKKKMQRTITGNKKHKK